MPLFSSIKDGAQKKNGYKNLILLYYKFEDEQKPYLNFMVKLTIGVTASSKHIQYSVNKVEVNTAKKNRPSYTVPHFRLDRPWSDWFFTALYITSRLNN